MDNKKVNPGKFKNQFQYFDFRKGKNEIPKMWTSSQTSESCSVNKKSSVSDIMLTQTKFEKNILRRNWHRFANKTTKFF